MNLIKQIFIVDDTPRLIGNLEVHLQHLIIIGGQKKLAFIRQYSAVQSNTDRTTSKNNK